MSQISVLGFTPSSSSSSSSSPGIHWAILISPFPPTTKAQKRKSRFFHHKTSTKELQSDSILFDMHNHQLRQQPFPIPLKSDPSPSPTNSNAAPADSESAALNPPRSNSQSTDSTTDTITITTLDAESSHPLQLRVKISASILAQADPLKLIPRLSQRLYTTPTYGPEVDWLRNALSAMHEGGRGVLLEPGFDVDKFVEYAIEAAKDYAMYDPEGQPFDDIATEPVHPLNKETTVLELDYRAHIARNNEVKELLTRNYNHHPQQELPTPPQSPKITHVAAKTAKSWLGFRISPSPGTRGGQPSKKYSFERQDDPYGGLM